MKNICFISPSLHQGGLENAVMVMSNEMAKRGHQVSIICVYNNPIFYKLDERIKIIIPTYKRNDFSTAVYYLKSIFYLRKEIKNIKPDVIVSYGDFLNPISLLATRKLNIPVFISDRSSPGKKFPFIVQKMREFIYPFATGIIAQTATAKRQKQKMLKGYKNIQIIPNPIRPINNYPDSIKENIVLGVARHYHVKGLDRLIEAFAKTNHSDWRLVIAGNKGPHTDELIRLTKKYKITDKVDFLGAVKEIDKVFSSAKIFVLSSRSEGFPNALIEAMANGVASISFDINAGPSDIIKNNYNGFLVENGNIETLANRIQLLMDDEIIREKIALNALSLKEQLKVEKIGDLFYNFITKPNANN